MLTLTLWTILIVALVWLVHSVVSDYSVSELIEKLFRKFSSPPGDFDDFFLFLAKIKVEIGKDSPPIVENINEIELLLNKYKAFYDLLKEHSVDDKDLQMKLKVEMESISEQIAILKKEIKNFLLRRELYKLQQSVNDSSEIDYRELMASFFELKSIVFNHISSLSSRVFTSNEEKEDFLDAVSDGISIHGSGLASDPYRITNEVHEYEPTATHGQLQDPILAKIAALREPEYL